MGLAIEKFLDKEQEVRDGKEIAINGYKIRWNDHWKEFQVSHSDIGGVEGFKKFVDAIEHAIKG